MAQPLAKQLSVLKHLHMEHTGITDPRAPSGRLQDALCSMSPDTSHLQMMDCGMRVHLPGLRTFHNAGHMYVYRQPKESGS